MLINGKQFEAFYRIIRDNDEVDQYDVANISFHRLGRACSVSALNRRVLVKTTISPDTSPNEELFDSSQIWEHGERFWLPLQSARVLVRFIYAHCSNVFDFDFLGASDVALFFDRGSSKSTARVSIHSAYAGGACRTEQIPLLVPISRDQPKWPDLTRWDDVLSAPSPVMGPYHVDCFGDVVDALGFEFVHFTHGGKLPTVIYDGSKKWLCEDARAIYAPVFHADGSTGILKKPDGSTLNPPGPPNHTA